MRNKILALALLILALFTAAPLLSKDKQIQATVTDTMDMGAGVMEITFKPQEKFPPLDHSDVLFGGKPVGRITGISPNGDSFTGYFKPTSGFQVNPGMKITLLLPEMKEAGPLSLPITIIRSGRKILFKIPAGKDKGIEVGQHFSVELCNGFPQLDFAVMKVLDNTSELEFRTISDGSVNRKAVIDKLQKLGDYIQKNGALPKDCGGSPYATEMVGVQDMPIGFQAHGGVAESSGNSEQLSIPISLSGAKFIADTGYLRYALEVTNTGKKQLANIKISCTFLWGKTFKTPVAQDSALIPELDPGKSKVVELFSFIPSANFDPTQYPNGIEGVDVALQYGSVQFYTFDVIPSFDIQADGYPSTHFGPKGVFF